MEETLENLISELKISNMIIKVYNNGISVENKYAQSCSYGNVLDTRDDMLLRAIYESICKVNEDILYSKVCKNAFKFNQTFSYGNVINEDVRDFVKSIKGE